MSVSVAQLSKFQFNWNNAPIVGGLLFTYASGTTTKLTTYQDSFGAVPNTNPIVLDANGQCNLYLTDGLSYKFVVSPPGDTDPPTNPYWTADNILSAAGAAGGISASIVPEGPFESGTDFTPGTTTTLTLSQAYGQPVNVTVHFDGIYQAYDQYSISGDQIIFNSPIPVGTNTVYIVGGLIVGGDAVSASSLANTTDPTQGVALVGGASRVVASIAALRTLPKTGSPEVFVTGYYAQGDGGGGAYWYDSTDTTSADNGVTIIVASDGGRWKLATTAELNVKQVGAKGDNAFDNSTALAFMAANSLNTGWRIPAGQYKFSTAIAFDYTAGGFPIPGAASPRADVRGDTAPNSILAYSGTGTSITMSGSAAGLAGQGVYSLDRLSNFTLLDYAAAKSNSGIYLQRKEFFKLENININYMQTALWLASCFSAKLENINIVNCTTGIELSDAGDGACNAIQINRAELQGCSSYGIVAPGGPTGCGDANSFKNCSVESCGTQGNAATGGIVLNCGAYGHSGPLIFDSCYFEGNAGAADISISNTNAATLEVVMINCIFQRTLNTNYTTNNILLGNSGGGTIRLTLIGCSFVSTGTYVPSSARPFIAKDASCEVIDLGSQYSENTSFVQPPTHGRVMGGQVSSAAVLLAGPPQLSVTYPYAGVYRITHNSQFAANISNFFVVATAQDAAGIKVERTVTNSISQFDVMITNTAGTAVAGAFNFMVMQVN